MFSKKLFIFLMAVLVCSLFVLLAQFSITSGDPDMRELISEFKTLLNENKDAGRDVSGAMELNKRSREAFRDGRRDKAVKLLKEAISLLKGNVVQGSGLLLLGDKEQQEVVQTKGHSGYSDFIYGIMIAPKESSERENMEGYFQIAKDLGISYIKIGVLWDFFIEPEEGLRGRRDTFEDEAGGRKRAPRQGMGKIDYDYISSLSQKYKVSIIPTFLTSKIPRRETDPAGYAEFVYTFVARYRAGMNIKYIEFQNEPDAENDGSGNGRHWKGTAADLAKVDTAAYEKIKSNYPDIMVGSAGFVTGSKRMIERYITKFYKAYFAAKPRFDFFALHDYPKTYCFTQGTKVGDLASEYHIFETYRRLLDSYGYGDKPIFVTEGFEDKPREFNGTLSWSWADENEVATLFVESYIHTLSNAKRNNVIGKIISGVVASPASTIGLIDRDNREKRSQYYVLRHLFQLLKKYPIYSRHISGEVNSEDYWLEEFKNEKGEKLWITFNPILYKTNDEIKVAITSKTHKYPQEVKLKVGDTVAHVKLVKMSGREIKEESKPAINGNVLFTLEKAPVFIEEK